MKILNPLKLVMLVDDDDTTNYLNKRLLTRLKIAEEICVVTDGEQALEYLKKADRAVNSGENPCPDLILLDIKMPVMDGFEFLESYQEGDFQHKPVILMLTSSASFYDLEKLKQFPVVKKHYSKSLTENDLNEIMASYFPEHVA